MPRKGENIYKRKDGRWEGRYIKKRSPQGKAVYVSVYGKTYFAVREKLRAAAAGSCCGEGGTASAVITRSGSSDYSFDSLAWKWLKSMQPRVKESSYIKYKNLLQSYISPYFREQSIETVTEDFIQKYCDRLLSEGGAHKTGLSAKTVNDTLSVIRSIFRYAHAKGIHTICSGKEVTVRQTAGKLNIFSRDEEIRLYHYLHEHPSGKNLGIQICMMTGLRIGEICALKWSDISFSEKTIHIHQTMQRLQMEDDASRKTAVIISEPKSACSIRTIPLPDALRLLMERDFPVRQGYILTECDRDYMEPRALQKYFKHVLECNHIPPLKFHTLRHTFATRCVEVGFDVKSLSEILGHSNVTITMNRYVHPTMDLKSANMQKLSELFAVK